MPKFFKIETLLIIAVLAVAIFFRFWGLRDSVVFLGDEGRDMIVMRNIFVERNIPFLGPTASVGGFYLGPIYYWMAAPFLLVAGFDPVGPAVMVALFGVATVFVLYKFLKEAVGTYPALCASLLYASAPLVVRYSRSSWNPNPLPFFSLLLMYFLFLGLKSNRLRHFLGAGACFGVAVQLHYLAVLLVPLFVIVIAANSHIKNWPKIILAGLTGFLITFAPFLLFEAFHNFPNFRTILEFVSRGSTVGIQNLNLFWLLANTGNILLEYIAQVKGTPYTLTMFWLLATGSIISLALIRKYPENKAPFVISIVWFLGGLAALKLYTGQINDYYFNFMFPAPFFTLGILLSIVWKNKVSRTASVLLVSVIFFFFLNNSFLKSPPNKLIDQTEEITDFIIEKTDNQPYNFALISNSNSDHAYRYFLEIKGYKPTKLEDMVTNQLLIICESKTCSPLGHPLWEIAAFGRGEIIQTWDIEKYGFKIFKLNHLKSEPSPAGKPAVK
jgi:4-amino-4-deoxy-L-arabinose transferase-like glycosyltransferase